MSATAGRRSRVRPPAVAGRFYPAQPERLMDELRASFRAARAPDTLRPAPKALVVPHAGYVYSGPIAASAYLRLAPGRSTIRRVVLLGPSHQLPLDGTAVSSADSWLTPLGPIPLGDDARGLSAVEPGVELNDVAHAAEHSLEVQLPFLQVVLDHFELLPLAVGRCTPEDVARLLDLLWGGPETVIVVSTDLSHYHPYAEAREIDRATAAAIVARRPCDIADRDACGAYPLRGLLVAAARRDLPVELLDLRNSGDTAGEKDRVVGYGAFAFG